MALTPNPASVVLRHRSSFLPQNTHIVIILLLKRSLAGAGVCRLERFKMFRAAARQFSVSTSRMVGTVSQLSIAEIEAGSRNLIEVSTAQGVAQRALVDGNPSILSLLSIV